jgi:hypothetical protein
VKRDMSRLSRRQMLRGAGTVAIALPILPELARAAGAPARTPQRLITFFFGNGMPPDYTTAAFDSPVLKPLAPHAAKISLLRGLNNRSAPGGVGHPHARGSSAFAVGYSNPSLESAGDRSLDVAAYQTWKPGTPFNTVATSLWWWSEDTVRNTHSWEGKNRPNPGVTKPLDLFHRLFGGMEMIAPAGSPEAAKAAKLRRYQKSVLDSVVEGYRYATSDAAGYSAETRMAIANHLESVRTLERRVVMVDQMGGGAACASPMAPADIVPMQTCSSGCDTKGDTATHDAGGGQSKSGNWDMVWPLLSDLFVTAMRCDLMRCGNLTCTASGDRYNYQGQSTNVHDLAHAWRPGGENGFNMSVTWLMGALAYFLKGMDDPSFTLPGGGTMLDNTAVLIGTEVSDPAPHSFSKMTFMLAGGGGVFKPGIYDYGDKSSEVDLYSTVSRSLGLGDKFGDVRYFTDYLTGIV